MEIKNYFGLEKALRLNTLLAAVMVDNSDPSPKEYFSDSDPVPLIFIFSSTSLYLEIYLFIYSNLWFIGSRDLS